MGFFVILGQASNTEERKMDYIIVLEDRRIEAMTKGDVHVLE